MRVVLLSHESSLAHDTGFGHPERPARIPAVLAGIRRAGFPLVELAAPEATANDLALVHEPAYIRSIERFCAAGGGSLDPDTVARPGSWEAALRSAGAGPAAIEALRKGEGDVAFVVTRPPGHHALPTRAMGFCLFNNIAIAARSLVVAGHRVAIFDWDVHHGNGTQDVFYDEPAVLYLSMHEFPAYPGTGWTNETGRGPGAGTTVNIPWPTGTDGGAYRWAMHTILEPVLRQYAPDWLLVSAGYDAHASDPLAGIRLVAADFRWMASRLALVVPPARTIFFLEGGYDLEALETSAAATLHGFAGEDGEAAPEAPDGTAARQISVMVLREVGRHWEI